MSKKRLDPTTRKRFNPNKHRRFELPVNVNGTLAAAGEPNQLKLYITDEEYIPHVIRALDHHFSARLGMNVERVEITAHNREENMILGDNTALLEFTPKIPGAGVDPSAIFSAALEVIKDLGSMQKNLRSQTQSDVPIDKAVDTYIKQQGATKVSEHDALLANAVLTKLDIIQAAQRGAESYLPDEVRSAVTESLIVALAGKPRPPVGVIYVGKNAHLPDQSIPGQPTADQPQAPALPVKFEEAGPEDGLLFIVKNAMPAPEAPKDPKEAARYKMETGKYKYVQTQIYGELAEAYRIKAKSTSDRLAVR